MNSPQIDDIILELSSIHHQLNILLFNNTLKKIKINVADNIRAKNKLTKGHFEAFSNWEDSGMQITIWTLSLNGDPYSVIEVLIHEMIHQWNFQNSIKDVENNGRHNKNFRDTALKYGLELPKTIRGKGTNDHGKGFNRTTLSNYLRDIIKNKLDFNWKVLEFKHKYAINYSPTNYKKRYRYNCLCNSRDKNTYMVKFTSSILLNIKCLDCNNIFKVD
ncbi:hypothetical protein SGLAD_v1c05120 [Spiroplasma gladiatoris]|uniref:SprT-like domain-containing protein n=1 Tax=Spiroplasma gladiatoris TaxID=2143 RepID=A0A4P7AHU0_9MOLU|nr:SprT-like domain-containing protein [Spiroplasma gladiatoris]QBQ07711.1 hypothetical protein SGLAD_v1c05120 [Spiroplasma gladiatoris]